MNRRVARAKERIKKERRKKVLKIGVRVIAASLVVAVITIVIYAYTYRLNIAYKTVNWSKIKYELDAVDVVEPIGGAVTQDSYHKVRMAASAETILKLKDVLPEKFLNNLLNGVQSNYYKDVVYSEYTETLKEIRDMYAQSEYILKMYDDYKSLDGFKDFEGCHSETCQLKKFIDSYTGQELHKYLTEVHQKWESLIEYQMTRVAVDDDTLNMFYQEEIITNLDYLESIQVTAYIINSKLVNKNDSNFVEKLKDKGKIPTTTLTLDNREALEMLSLYRSDKFYDDNIIGLAAPTLSKILQDYTGGNIIDLTGVEDIKEAIRNIKPPEASKRTAIMDLPYAEYSLVEQSKDDIIRIYFDIEQIKHIDNMPKVNDIKDKLEYKAKVYLAELDIADELDRRIKEDLGESYNSDWSTLGENHDHDGDGLQDHVWDEELNEWLIYDGKGNYILDEETNHDHDGDGIPDH